MEKEKIDPFKLIPDYDSYEDYDKPECKLSSYLKSEYDVVTLNEGLYVVQDTKREHWTRLHFLVANSWSDEETYVESLFKCEGTGDVLRECRHTYFPNDGYVFYMNYSDMTRALDYCKKFFDMD